MLVTGAGGSIGSELCRQISEFEPETLMMLDHDETLLMETKVSITHESSLDDDRIILADIREGDNLLEIFRDRRPEVVFHAAALKHVSALEAYPQEAWKTNSLGTLNVLRAAEAVGVKTFVNVSTDKAADPKTALGQSKRVAERLTAYFGEKTGNTYVSVRFGNVFGSRGSIKPLFTKQILSGGPITLTDKRATRYFMLITDACLLVMLAGAIGRPGEVMVLDMGQPVKILDVRRRCARRMSGMTWRSRRLVFARVRSWMRLSSAVPRSWYLVRRTGIFPGRVPRHLTLMSSIMSGGFRTIGSTVAMSVMAWSVPLIRVLWRMRRRSNLYGMTSDAALAWQVRYPVFSLSRV